MSDDDRRPRINGLSQELVQPDLLHRCPWCRMQSAVGGHAAIESLRAEVARLRAPVDGKAVAWWNTKFPQLTVQMTKPHDGGGWEPLYSAAQMTQLRNERDEWRGKWADERGNGHNLVAATQMRDQALQELQDANARIAELEGVLKAAGDALHAEARLYCEDNPNGPPDYITEALNKISEAFK